METGKTVRIVTGEALLSTGETFAPGAVTDGKSALRATMMMILKHTADMFVTIVDIVAETYELDKDEMMKAVQEHPRFTDMLVNPVLHDLAYLERPAEAAGAEAETPAAAAAPPVEIEEVPPALAEPAAPEAPVKKRRGPKPISEMTPAELEEHKKKVAERKEKKAAAAAPPPPPEPAAPAAAPPPEEPIAAAAEAAAAAPPKKRTFVIKPKARPAAE